MYSFSNPNISFATVQDVPAITSLLNRAYRGDSSKQGWTNEAHLIAGDVRTNNDIVKQKMIEPESVFLTYSSEPNDIVGCVNLQRHGNNIYLGMFSVWPNLQGRGIGKDLLRAAEEYAKQRDCNRIYMSVISLRSDLIQWYERHGYRDTGERKPFREDGTSGKHLQALEFMMLEKILS